MNFHKIDINIFKKSPHIMNSYYYCTCFMAVADFTSAWFLILLWGESACMLIWNELYTK